MSGDFIPVANPGATIAPFLSEIQAAMERVLRGGRFVLGPEVDSFEEEFATACGASHCVSVANGTDAVELALRAVGVEPGDEVITVANTVTATISAITAIGAKPSFVEIDPLTFGMSTDALAQRLRTKPAKAIVPVHLYGHPVDMATVCALAQEHGAKVVEDCAQAVGAAWQGRQVGTWGDAAAFSFYPTKNLGCLGDGGAVLTRHRDVADRLRSLRQYGWAERYVSQTPGRNSRLDELQAAILRTLLPRLPDFNQRRREIAHRYHERLAGSPFALPSETPDARAVYHQVVIRTVQRDTLREHLQQSGIGTAVLYPVPIHRQPGHAQVSVSLPVTETAAQELLCLPIYPGLTDETVDRVAAAILSWTAAV